MLVFIKYACTIYVEVNGLVMNVVTTMQTIGRDRWEWVGEE